MKSREPLAIVGIGCRFPGDVQSPDQLWKLLAEGVDAITEVPANRWDIASFYHPDPTKPGRAYARWGGFLEDVDQFDARFFGISPREAAKADPQQRLLLEVAYEALEDAGIPQERIAGSTGGVFVGISSYDYGGMQYRENERSGIDAYTNVGAALCIAANRISYLFDLRGPSLAVDTACSSSLVAAHLACQSIWDGKCELAFVAGVNLILRPEVTIGFSKASMLAPDGRCKSFDARANGYVRAEGCGVVIVKPLLRALDERDSIYAVIRATAVNQDGRTAGICVPNEVAQEAMLREALCEAGIYPEGIQYVEAHGTGTSVGDPIEARALGNVLGKQRATGSYCLIGSIKSNIGHLESASGIAGLIKAALCLKHGQIPASLHLETPNPEIPFEDLRLRVVRALEDWPDTNGHQRRAGVNAFGFGGTNAHVVLESAPETPLCQPVHKPPAGDQAYLLPLSAHSGEALRALVRSYAVFFSEDAGSRDITLRDISYTCSLRRTHHDHRLSVVARTQAELVEHLRAFLVQESRATTSSGCTTSRSTGKLAFVCSGMGQQWWAMGRELFAEERVYRETIERVDALLCALSGWSLLDELMANEDRSKIDETRIAQPAIFSMQVALAALWRSWGIEPTAVVGHSVGEVAAAYIAGALTLEDAVQVVFHRSRLQQRIAGKGAMLAVGLGNRGAAHLLAGKELFVSVAAVNSLRSITLTGDVNALEEIETVLNEQGVFCRFLQVDVPYHSPMMEPLRQELLDCLCSLNPQPASTPLFSTVTGAAVAGSDLDADYWWRNIRNPVQFHAAMMEMIRHDYGPFLEIGAHPILSLSISECLAETKEEGSVLPSLRRKEPERAIMLGSVGRLYTLGEEIDWRKLQPDPGVFIKLPSYPWQREKHWHESERSRRDRLGQKAHPLLGIRLETAHASWEVDLDLSTPPYLSDHRVREMRVYPAAAYVEMALAAAHEVLGARPCALEDVEFRRALLLKEGETSNVQVTLNLAHTSFEILSRDSGSSSWVLNSNGRLRKLTEPPAQRAIALTAIRERCQKLITKAECYRVLASVGLDYGSMFQGIERLWRGEGEALGEIRIPTCLEDQLNEYRLHPVLLDSCCQVLLGAKTGGEQGHDIQRRLYLPVRIEKVAYYRAPGQYLLSYARLVGGSGQELKGEIQLLDETGECFAEIRGFTCRLAERSAESLRGCFYAYRWKLQPRSRDAVPVRNSDHLPSPRELAQSLREEAEHLRERLRRDRYYADFLPLETDMTAAYVVQGLRRLGWDPTRHAQVSAEQLSELLGVVPEHRRLLGYLLQRLSGNDIAAIERDPLPLWNTLWERFPDAQAELMLIRECGGRLPSFLRGESDPLSHVFPEGRSATIEHYYHDSPTYRIYNLLAKRAIGEIVRRLPEGRIIRVLEIGGGTGGMTSYVLPMLPPQRVEYVFTDLAPLQVRQAEQKFRQYSFIQYRTLDIESDPIKQGLAAHSFDVILASDLLHATRDLRLTLERVARLIGSGGELVLLEWTRAPLGTVLVFGLLKGWWLFTDETVRDADPWVPLRVWQSLLERASFTETTFVTDCDDPQNAVHSVIVARAPKVELGILASRAITEHAQTWLLLAGRGTTDRPSATVKIAALLTERGDHPIMVWPGNSFRQIDAANYQVRPGSREDIQCLIGDMRQTSARWRGIVHLWGLDTAGYERASGEDLGQAWKLSCVSLVQLVQALAASQTAEVPGLILVTGHAHFVPGAAGEVDVAQAPLFGLGRVVANQYPQLRCRMVDLATGSPHEIQSLVEELYADEQEDEIAIRGEARYVHRLVEVSRDALDGMTPQNTTSAFRIAPQIPGNLETLAAHPVARRSVGSGEVEIMIRYAGLNFKDVMLAMGLLPEEVAEDKLGIALGMECAGRVVAVGEGVQRFDVGDDVIACGPGCLASHVTVDARLVVRKPDHLSCEEAATIPIAFLTAYYALHYLGRMQRGERVLIHGASGGVGLAAIQLAKRCGAEIFATGGTTTKRQLLQALGVPHVMDSRSLAFAEEVLELTRGEGVDLVLNSLAGDAISKSLSILRPFGRFLELGKRAIYENNEIGLRPFHNNLAFFSIDLAQVYGHNRDLLRSLFEGIIALIDDRSISPISHRTFPVGRVAGALRHLAQARHVGKIVLSLDETEGIPWSQRREAARFRSNGTYLITGGLGGFGLAVADWLVQNGARHLVLIGRSGASSSAAQAGVQSLKAKGADVIVHCADVTALVQMQKVFNTVRESMPPLRGVVHAAMVLDDALIEDQSEELIWKVLAPKALGAWNLHTLTVNTPLDFFVLFSSFSSLIGNPGQANYAAGNAFLDSLAYYRRLRGLPALTINWGPVADVGYVARSTEISRRFEQIGVKSIPVQQLLVILGELLTGEAVQVGLVQIDWERALRLLGSRVSRRFADLVDREGKEEEPAVETAAVRAVLEADPAQRQLLIEFFIREHLAKVLGTSANRLESDQPLQRLGLDSLMALEMGSRIQMTLGVDLPPVDFLEKASIGGLAAFVAEQLGRNAVLTEHRLPDAATRR
jgi:acyl transferase domain-containing protein/NADPH:quinone reductase-like Zn-dependent oxidoreductase/SAM-dependent methyltransferase/acyl carrier protein